MCVCVCVYVALPPEGAARYLPGSSLVPISAARHMVFFSTARCTLTAAHYSNNQSWAFCLFLVVLSENLDREGM